MSTCPVCCSSDYHFYQSIPFVTPEHMYERTNIRIGNPDMVIFYRCNDCGSYACESMRSWTSADFKEFVYNDNYVCFDPEFESIRPIRMAQCLLEGYFKQYDIKTNLDIGGGSGVFADYLSSHGVECTTFDKFYIKDDVVIRNDYESATCIEVLEHTYDPNEIFDYAYQHLKSGAKCFFTTVVINDSVDLSKHSYALPRNGHVLFYTSSAIMYLIQKHGFKLVHTGTSDHIFRKI